MKDARKAATRPIGNIRIQQDGSIVAESTLSPESFVVGAEVWIPPRKVIPIVFLPGIMGSNLKVDPGSKDTVRRRMGATAGSRIPDPWRPPNGLVEGCRDANKWNGFDPRARQALLSGDITVVDDSGFLETQVDGLLLSNLTTLNDEEARFRGWGTVHWDSYGEYLLYLERELRNLQDPRMFLNPGLPTGALDDPHLHAAAEWWPLLHAGEPVKDRLPSAFKVTVENLGRMSRYWFPVYAFGYNWLNSCAESARRLLDTLEKIIQVYACLKGPSGKQLFECEKVILVTHSMGGLVGRWASLHDERKRILGVVHGVQPAVGAPLAYRRAVAGTEPGGVVQNAFAVIAGRTQAETAPVMCNSAGSLQLLPSKLYPKGWLKLEATEARGGEGKHQVMESLPKHDPYEEIYRQKYVWWRLADPDLLDPAGRFTWQGRDPWTEGYLKFLYQAESFHDKLGDYYHPNTYVCYGDDPGHASFGTVRWRVEPPTLATARVSYDEILQSRQPDRDMPPTLQPLNNMKLEDIKREFSEALLKGRRMLQVYPQEIERFAPGSGLREVIRLYEHPDGRSRIKPEYLFANIQPQDAPGDGTVPWQSGEAPGKAGPRGRTFAIRGYDHQGCYDHDGPRRFSLWAIARIVSEQP